MIFILTGVPLPAVAEKAKRRRKDFVGILSSVASGGKHGRWTEKILWRIWAPVLSKSTRERGRIFIIRCVTPPRVVGNL